MKATAALVAATVVWGVTFVTVKDALSASDSFTFLTFRFGVGALAAWAVSHLGPKAVGQWSAVWRPGLLLGMFLFGGYALQTVGLETTTPARSAFITGLTVIFVPFISWRLSGKKPPTRAFVAPVVAVVGLQQLTQVSFASAIPLGDVLTLGCAVMYAVHIALMGRLAGNLPALPLTAVQLAVVAVFAASSLPFVELHFEPTVAYGAGVIFTGVVAGAVAISVQAWAQPQMTAARAAVIYALEPVFTLLWAMVAGLGWPNSAELVGGAFMLGAVLISEVGYPRPRE